MSLLFFLSSLFYSCFCSQGSFCKCSSICFFRRVAAAAQGAELAVELAPERQEARAAFSL